MYSYIYSTNDILPQLLALVKYFIKKTQIYTVFYFVGLIFARSYFSLPSNQPLFYMDGGEKNNINTFSPQRREKRRILPFYRHHLLDYSNYNIFYVKFQ